MDLPDARALSLPDEPYSAYCKVCWQSIYGCWVDTVPHHGKCPSRRRSRTFRIGDMVY
jgi:hypothetical protein